MQSKEHLHVFNKIWSATVQWKLLYSTRIKKLTQQKQQISFKMLCYTINQKYNSQSDKFQYLNMLHIFVMQVKDTGFNGASH